MSEPTLPAANRILIIDDNAAIHADFRKILTVPVTAEAGLRATESLLFSEAAEPAPTALPVYELDSAYQGEEGLRLVERAAREGRPYALAFVDVRMPPGWDGIETVSRIWQQYPDLPVVICTAYSDYSWPAMMARLGYSPNLVVLRKPFEVVEVLQLAHSLTSKWRLACQVRNHIAALDGLVAARTRNLEAANAALQHSEERFAKAFRNNPVPLLLVDAADGRLVDVNESLLQLTGIPRAALLGKMPKELNLFRQPEVAAELHRTLSAALPVRNQQTEFQAHDGRNFTALLSAEPLELHHRPHALLSLQDITERINVENQLRQAQKMEAVGQIAAGVAHDFNNLLAVIQGHAEMHLHDQSWDESLPDSMQEICQAARRAAALTGQLLAFSRKQMLQPRALDFAELLNNIGRLLHRIIGEEIHLRIQCAENLPPVMADQTNLEQVVINLAVNARDAMPKGGPLTITAELVVVDAQYQMRQPDAVPGTFVKLSVADEGVGMEEAVRSRIFEPFFTTKAVGKGTGLGLATVYGIVKQHHGWIEVESRPGAGSVFKVFLPLSPGDVKKTAEPGTDLFRAADFKPRTILIVEDEAPLRVMAAKILKRLGHIVVTAQNGPDALILWPQYRGTIELLFTDMRMPGGMSGRELAEKLLQDEPGLRVLYSTGYSVDLSNPELNLVEGVNLLMKPYDVTALKRAVRNIFRSAT